MDDKAKERKEKSGAHFWQYVCPLLQNKLNVEVRSLELLQDNPVIEAFDKSGVDAFYMDGKKLRGLASRMRYSSWGGESFTFRYRPNREYQRLKDAIVNPSDHVQFPHLHAESFLDEDSQSIIWSYAAKTQDIIRFIMANEPNFVRNRFKKDRVRIESIAGRDIVVVPIAAFKEEHEIINLK